MKRIIVTLSVIALFSSFGVSTLFAGKPGGGGTTTYKILANNDLGMHCTCPEFDFVTVLPPFNTFRAQVIAKSASLDPTIVTDNAKFKLVYSVLENTDAKLKVDAYYQNWIKNAPKLFPGFNPVRPDGTYQGLTGAGLSGEMSPVATAGGWWEVKGVPVYPVVTNTAADIMTDPLGGPKRDPYLTGQIQLVDRATNAVLATDQFTVPVAYGGCCTCHLTLAQSYGYPNPTPLESFKVMGMLHAQNSSRIDISTIDPDHDGIPGPIRCSQCHLDPAMGESVPPDTPVMPSRGTPSRTSCTVTTVPVRWFKPATLISTRTAITVTPATA